MVGLIFSMRGVLLVSFVLLVFAGCSQQRKNERLEKAIERASQE